MRENSTSTHGYPTHPLGRFQPVLHASFGSWGRAQAQYLLMRAAFGATPQEIDTAVSLSRDEVVELLLQDSELPEPPGDWVNEPYITRGLTDAEKKELRRKNRERYRDLVVWWLKLMASGPTTLREKMVLFWHGHFVTEAAAVKIPQYLYRYNDTLRRNALGNFRMFLREIWKDPAMLIYLNGNQNKAQKPNENFARELMELFTMGVDSGYTEMDIKESARAFTGWQVDNSQLTAVFRPRLHDYGQKTFLNHTGNFNGDDIIDIILQQPVTAEFICTKLYRFFVSPEVNPQHVQELAEIFRNSDYEIKPVLRTIFTSDYFYDVENVGAIIKSPVHLAVSLVRQAQAAEVDPIYIFNAAAELDQTLFNPPNVAGWPGQRSWISPVTLASRSLFGEAAIMGGRIDRKNFNPQRQKPIKINVMDFARAFGIETPRELLNAWLEHFLSFQPDPVTRDFLLSVLLEGADESDWSLEYEGVEERIKNCLAQIFKLPEYQLI